MKMNEEMTAAERKYREDTLAILNGEKSVIDVLRETGVIDE